jgi:hypothetical protein
VCGLGGIIKVSQKNFQKGNDALAVATFPLTQMILDVPVRDEKHVA